MRGLHNNNVIKSVNLPDLTPLPIPRGLVGQKLNSLIQQAVQIFSDHKKFHPNNSSVIINSINNHNTNINNNISNNNNKVINSNIMANTNSSSSSSSQQYKLSPNNAMAQQFQQNQSAQQQQNMTDYNAAIMAFRSFIIGTNVVDVLGVIIVGMSSVLFPPKLSSDYDDFNDNSIIKPNNDQEDKDVSDAILGIFCIVFAQVFTASQFVLEEKIMKIYRVKPLKAVGYEGIFGLGTMIFGMIILHFTIGVHQPDGYFNIPTSWNQIISYQQIWITGIANCFSVAFCSFFGLSITRSISATSRSTIETCTILFIWVVSIVLGWEVFSWLQVFGFISLILGTFIFNNVMRPPPCFSYPLTPTENQPLLPEDEHI
ncbi:16063_t:CDS:2 [Entrophospora sp. SA101]|nr:16063_t:CDS:2 [Entrophospora sp. SA101]